MCRATAAADAFTKSLSTASNADGASGFRLAAKVASAAVVSINTSRLVGKSVAAEDPCGHARRVGGQLGRIA